MREADITARLKAEIVTDIIAQISSNPRLSPSVLENAPWQRTHAPSTDFEKRLERLEEWRAQLESDRPQTTSDHKLASTAAGALDSMGTPVPLAAAAVKSEVASSGPPPTVEETRAGKLRAIALEPSVWDSALLIGMDRHHTLACSAWAVMVLLLNLLVQARMHACTRVSICATRAHAYASVPGSHQCTHEHCLRTLACTCRHTSRQGQAGKQNGGRASAWAGE